MKKGNNQGFSLVELIIVIAIMAILVGVVGTQVVPYIEKSRQAKDVQIVSAICTATMSAYSNNAAVLDATADYALSFTTAGLEETRTPGTKLTPASVVDDLKELSSYENITEIKDEMTSKASADITQINMTYSGSRASCMVKVILTPGSKHGRVFMPVSSN